MDDAERLREAVRRACLEAARAAWEDAQMRGLCAEGALEAALGAIEMLDISAVSSEQEGKP